jgi:hypothetical protein
MSWLITPQLKSVDGVPIGTPYSGGYVAGFISHNQNGVPTHALIVAPVATGASGASYSTLTTMYTWKTAGTTTSGTTSVFDGVANTSAMVTAGINDHPAAKFCTELSIGGFTDWYLPSRDELDIAYFNLKPTTLVNSTAIGINAYSVPKRNSNYTSTFPAQTGLAIFESGGSEAFADTRHWTSTEAAATTAVVIVLDDGRRANFAKTSSSHTRAFRRITL